MAQLYLRMLAATASASYSIAWENWASASQLPSSMRVSDIWLSSGQHVLMECWRSHGSIVNSITRKGPAFDRVMDQCHLGVFDPVMGQSQLLIKYGSVWHIPKMPTPSTGVLVHNSGLSMSAPCCKGCNVPLFSLSHLWSRAIKLLWTAFAASPFPIEGMWSYLVRSMVATRLYLLGLKEALWA